MSVLLAFEIFRSARFDRNHKLTCFLLNRVLIQALVAFSLSVDHPGRSAHRERSRWRQCRPAATQSFPSELRACCVLDVGVGVAPTCLRCAALDQQQLDSCPF